MTKKELAGIGIFVVGGVLFIATILRVVGWI